MTTRESSQNMLRMLLILLLSILSLCISGLTVNAETEVNVGISAQSKPYNYYDDNGELTGFEIELFEELDNRLEDYTFTYSTTEFASLFAGLDAGTFDIIGNNIGENPERREKYLYSQYPYVITHNVLITRPEEGENLTLEDLAGKSMGLVAGSSQAIFMEEYNAANPDNAVNLQYVDTDASTIIRGVESGQYDSTIYSTTYLNDVEQTFGIDLVGHPIENEDEIQPPGAYFLYRRDDAESLALRQAIDGVLAEMREDGFLAEISEKYFNQNDTELTEDIIAKNDAIEAERSETTEVSVGISAQSKPYNYYGDNGELTGFEVELFEELDRRLDKYTFNYSTTEFASLFAGLDAGTFDVIGNNIGENPERREKYLYSLYPYVITHNVLITRPDEGENLTLEDLAGKSMGLVAGSSQAIFMEEYNAANPDNAVNLQYVDTDASTIIRGVESGQYDSTIYSTTYLNDVEQTFGIDLVGHPIENEDEIQPPGAYFLYRRDDLESLELRNDIDVVLADMREDGFLAEISEKYFNQNDTELTEDIIAKNDAIEAERVENMDVSENAVAEESESTDGKIFAPEMIPGMIVDIIEKLPITLLMTIVSAAIGLILGLLIAIVKIREVPILTQLLNLFVSFMRGTPQLVQLFLAFYGFPLVVSWANQQFGWNVDVNGIPALVYVFIAFGLNEAAYNSETFRAAILSVDKHEIEAAKSIGLTNRQTMSRIILPSAMVVAVPNLGNSLISLLKGTSLAFTVTVIDIMGQARIIAGSNLRFFEAYIAVALIYWVLCLIIEQFVKWLEKRLNVQAKDVELADVNDITQIRDRI